MKKYLLYLLAVAFVVFAMAQPGHTATSTGAEWTNLKITPDGGIAVKMTNAHMIGLNSTSGGSNGTAAGNATYKVPAGALVGVNASKANGFQMLTGTESSDQVVGVTYAASYPGDETWVVVAGVAKVLAPQGFGLDAGDGIFPTKASTDAASTGRFYGRVNATEALNATSLGQALESVTGSEGGNGTAKVRLRSLFPCSGSINW